MTRSSRHKSSKHREVREYSDSEKDSSLKDRKESGGGGARVSSEKRKLDLKEGKESGNGEYAEELGSSKRRKERVVDDGGSDRWNGGEYEHRGGSGEGSKKAVKGSGDSKSRKRDGSVEMYGEGGEGKKSGSGGGKGEGKHRDRDKDSSRKEGGGVEREKDREREKKSKDGRSERLGSGGDEQRLVAKQGNENTDLNGRKELESPEPENQIERRMRKRRDDSGDADKHLDYVEDINGGRLSSRDDLGKEGRQKDEKRKDERYREKFREDMDGDNKHRDEKQRDEKQRDDRSTKDHLSSKSEDKHLRDEKDISDMQQKRSKLQDGERKGEHDRDRNRDRDSYHVRERERYHDREREREHGWDHGRDRDRDYDRDWDWDRERDGDRDRERNHDRERARDRDKDGDRDRDREYDRDYDGSHLDDRSTRYKDSSRGKRRSPDDRDDSTDTKSRGVKPRYSDFEKKSSSGDRVESDVNKGRSQSRQAYVDTILSSNKRRTSPSSNSNAGIDEYRYANPEDMKYRDSMAEQRSKALPPRDVSGVSERGSKYRSMEKSSKMDDSHLGELSNEKPSGSKASPMALMERSPSSSSIDRRYMNKTAVRRSIDIEETGRRSSASMDNRDFSNSEDRPSRDLALEKPFVDDSSPADSSTHNRSGQSNFSSFAPHPNFRAGVESPSFTGSVEDDGRGNSSARYRRSSDPNLVRGPWRGVPNWPSPVPNGFMPFPHGGPHVGFQGMLPQFSAPPHFGVRPSMEINHYAIPYQIADDRFSGHLRPLGSQNIMEGLGPSHMHPWDGSTGAFRDDSNSYGAEWDQNRHPMSARGWDPSAEPWKVHNNDVKRDLPSPSPRNDYPVQTPVDDGVAGQVGQMSHHEDNLDLGVHTKTAETRSTIASPMKESPITREKSRDGSKSAIDKVPSLSHYYLSKLDISAELAHTELYNQCMSLLDTEGSATVDEDPTMHTILKAATAGLKSSKTLLSSSLFPPLKDCIFQKAMDLYKKQRMEAKGMSFVAGGRLDIILASNQKNMEAKVSEVEKVEQLVLKSDAEMADAPVSSSDEKNALVTVSTDSVKELVSTPGHEMQNHISLGSPKLEMAVEDSSQVEPEEPQTIPNGVEMDSMSSEQEKLEVDNADGFSLLDNKVSLPTNTTLPADGYGVNKVKDDYSIYHAEEGVAVDAIRGPLVIPDGSPKACEALMSGSNESDSVILSRIHHSPESTH
ncbi:hypothetical protein RchiOBHm_Chr1g0380961 [Rosa chinensis]|uniref:Uncharacterized protein n=2 Tax=Rosa chinensis TaxID=74649 RepID=A0A2P6SP17_ROSCH|nr:uncharacterized protein LOC112183424 isoform X1 [Rosa chinensis]PRQ60417.1 hypothetical protein RchiOBHm_Chr1g0380961 [Rosa chinensis]